jgi:hypothetical protein
MLAAKPGDNDSTSRGDLMKGATRANLNATEIHSLSQCVNRLPSHSCIRATNGVARHGGLRPVADRRVSRAFMLDLLRFRPRKMAWTH